MDCERDRINEKAFKQFSAVQSYREFDEAFSRGVIDGRGRMYFSEQGADRVRRAYRDLLQVRVLCNKYREDAERYQWLKNMRNRERGADMVSHRMNLDSAIDEVMAKEEDASSIPNST